MAKVLLINPKGSELASHGNSQVPIGYLYLAAELKKDSHQVKFVDGVVSTNDEIKNSFKWNPDIIGVQCLTIKRKEAFDLMRLARKICPDAKIISGGPHSGSCKEQVLKNYDIDGVCHGEGEKWIRHYANTGDEPPNTERYENLDELPVPAYDLVDFRMYHSHLNDTMGLKAWVQFGRGCGWSCTFCSVWSIWGKYRVRSPENMMEELRYLYYHRNIRHINFVDDIMTQEREPVFELCEKIIKDGMKVKFHFLTRVDCVDQELLNILGQAGCYDIDYGTESGSDIILKNIHKDKDISEYTDTCYKAIQMTKKAGINATALIMIGNRGETTQTVLSTKQVLKRYNPTSIHTFRGVYLLPQTALFQQTKREGLIDDDCWLDETKIYFYPYPKRMLLFWHFIVSSVRFDIIKRMIMNFVLQRQKMGEFRRWFFLRLRKRVL